MRLLLSAILFSLSLVSPLASQSAPLTFSNHPTGTEGTPLVLRTYLPNPGLEPDVLTHHHPGNPTPRYSPHTGQFSKAKDQPVPGIPAAIAVNLGPKLSYAWDTTECRLLYAWDNGFLDMESYWGTPTNGRRKKNDYVPRLIGNLFYQATGAHPLLVDGENISTFQYLGHTRSKGRPLFLFQANSQKVELEIGLGSKPQTVQLTYRSDATLDYKPKEPNFQILSQEEGELKVSLAANTARSFTGFQEEALNITKANVQAGQKLYTSQGCYACHSTDGSQAHGPSFAGLADSQRFFVDDTRAIADTAYLTQSIKNPEARHVKGYPVGMMPAYPLQEKEISSLVLYIQSLKSPAQ